MSRESIGFALKHTRPRSGRYLHYSPKGKGELYEWNKCRDDHFINWYFSDWKLTYSLYSICKREGLGPCQEAIER